MQRQGKALRELPKGDRRRMSDFRNAWRKMAEWQRQDALEWIITEGTVPAHFIIRGESAGDFTEGRGAPACEADVGRLPCRNGAESSFDGTPCCEPCREELIDAERAAQGQ
jgi:hypothetical protein